MQWYQIGPPRVTPNWVSGSDFRPAARLHSELCVLLIEMQRNVRHLCHIWESHLLVSSCVTFLMAPMTKMALIGIESRSARCKTSPLPLNDGCCLKYRNISASVVLFALQPRRVAAVTVAQRVADEKGCSLGSLVCCVINFLLSVSYYYVLICVCISLTVVWSVIISVFIVWFPELTKLLLWNIVLYGSETSTLWHNEIERLKAFEMWIWRRMLKISWTEHKANDEVLELVKEQRKLMTTLRQRQKHVLRHNSIVRK